MPGGERTVVLYVSHEPECGGAELSLLDLIGNLDRDLFTALLACSGPGPLSDAARARGAAVHFVPMLFEGKLRKLRKLIGIRAAARRLADLARSEGVALLHSNTLIAGYCALGAAGRAGVPLAWHVRDLGYPALGRWACGKATCVIANSKATAADLQLDAEVIYNGVDEAFFETAPDAPRSHEGVVVGMAGRIDPWKGHEDLLAAAAQVPNARFVVAGGALFGKGEAYLASLRRSATDNVEFLGPVADMPRFMASIDILVHPSRDPEPFGRAVAEAMAAGKPVVATDHGGLPEVVGDAGFLVPPRDPGALATRVRELVEDAALRARLGEAARARASKRFTVARHVAQVQAIYRGMISRRSAGEMR